MILLDGSSGEGNTFEFNYIYEEYVSVGRGGMWESSEIFT